MPSENPDTIELVRRVVREELATKYAPFPARVMAVNAEVQTVDVVPWHADLSVLRDVPLLVPGSAASSETIKVHDGDWVLCIPTMFSLDEFLGTDAAGPVRPRDPRQQDLMDVLAIPFVRNPSPSAAARLADRAIEGSEIKVGDAAAADPLLRGTTAFATAWNNFFTALDGALIAASAVPGTYAPGTIVAAKPALLPTTNLKGS